MNGSSSDQHMLCAGAVIMSIAGGELQAANQPARSALRDRIGESHKLGLGMASLGRPG